MPLEYDRGICLSSTIILLEEEQVVAQTCPIMWLYASSSVFHAASSDSSWVSIRSYEQSLVSQSLGLFSMFVHPQIISKSQ